MRLRPFGWFLISLLCFAAALTFWRLGNRWSTPAPAPDAGAATRPASAASREPAISGPSEPRAPVLLTQAGMLNSPAATRAEAPTVKAGSRPTYRLSNTTEPYGQFVANPAAILLENALVDTRIAFGLAIPPHLKASENPGAFIVQSRTAPDHAFREQIRAAGGEIVAYVPNNAYLVKASNPTAEALRGSALVQAVLAYEPYFKVRSGLLPQTARQEPLPKYSMVNVLLFPGERQTVEAQLHGMGASVVGEDRSPFGPVLKVQPRLDGVADIASLPGVQMIELTDRRVPANDLSRPVLKVSTDSVTEENYLGLTGSNVLVSVADTGVDATHPALLAPRIVGDVASSLVDSNGHGTFIAGIIAGSGAESTSVTEASGSEMPAVANQFRGKAPAAGILAMSHASPDWYLQETAAQTNALVANHSYVYARSTEYDLAAASYDAAVRDSLPGVTGAQGLAYVFPSGNGGGLTDGAGSSNDDGVGGVPDTVRSPGTAKNVITVGAIELQRNITNETTQCETDGSNCFTNAPWKGQTDTFNQVASFSSRGNVGIGVEGAAGRFKPDLVAPGAFVISTRSSQWDEASYYSGQNAVTDIIPGLLVRTNEVFTSGIFIPDTATQLVIRAISIRPAGAVLPIYINGNFAGNNVVTLPPDAVLGPVNDYLEYEIANGTNVDVTFNLQTTLWVTNEFGNYFEVLRGMNDKLGTKYRYESGTSLAAAQVSGVLALMHEFFATRLARTNSPALMKALLINGARSTSDIYDMQVLNTMNLQGWGLLSLANSLPGALSNAVSEAGSSPVFAFDQSPTNALATGQSHTRTLSLDAGAQGQPLRFTLVWTDPPGNPIVGVKLVNDLDLVVTNLDTGEVFFGNDITADNDFNQPWDTNTPPILDGVNNVENVYLKNPLSTNYSVTVIGRRVNVNAVTAHADAVVQDYAMVISTGDGGTTNVITLQAPSVQSASQPLVTAVTNMFVDNPGANVSGGLLMGQRVGANAPLQGTNTLALPGGGVLTVGVTNQWHFYVVPNEKSYTNAAFVTFMPPNLSVPRIGVREADPDNASRPQADIDMYVSTDPALTNLDPAVLSAAIKSQGRGGTEMIALSNAAPGAVYYVGIKSEDQQAAQYSFLGIFSLNPFGVTDDEGNQYLVGLPAPAVIPDGTPEKPEGVQLLALCLRPTIVRRVVVTNTITHPFPGNLVGILGHGTKFATLHNKSCKTDPNGDCITNTVDYIYEDNEEGDIPFSQPSAGPGNLKEFMGEEGVGVWMFNMANNFPSGTGYVNRLLLKIEPQNLDPANARERWLLPRAWTYDSIDVPANATNLVVCVTGNTVPVELYLARDYTPNTSSYDHKLIINPPGDCLAVNPYSLPPLAPGRYYIGVFNPSLAATQRIRITAEVQLNPFAVGEVIPSGLTGTPLLDDAVSSSKIFVTNRLSVSDLDLGLLIRHERISDLAITLISPTGTRVLLFENRGAWSTNGAGTFSSLTNSAGVPVFGFTNMVPIYTNNFDLVSPGSYAPGVLLDTWTVSNSTAVVLPDYSRPWLNNRFVVPGGAVLSNSLPSVTNATAYRLEYSVGHAPYLAGTVGWWPLDSDGRDVFGGWDGLLCGGGDTLFAVSNVYAMFSTGIVSQAFYGDGVRASLMVPAEPELNLGPGNGFSIEGWIRPAGSNGMATSLMPIAEWSLPSESPTNLPVQGVQFWVGGYDKFNPVPGSLSAVIWATNGASYPLVTASNGVTNGGWQHVAMTYDRASQWVALYLNGVPVGGQVLPQADIVPRTLGDFYIGFHPGNITNVLAFRGALDEMGLYSRALSSCEVAALFGSGVNGKYGTNHLGCPTSHQIDLVTAAGTQSFTFTNAGPWQTISIEFAAPPPSTNTNSTATSLTGLVVRAGDPNVALDDFVLSALVTNYVNGLLHFTDNTNVARLPIKFAPYPFGTSNFPPTTVVINGFEKAAPGLYGTGTLIPGDSTNAVVGAVPWKVVEGDVAVVNNPQMDNGGSNWLALAQGRVQCDLPTVVGRRYQLLYSVRGPGMAGWWNGELDPVSQRALDLIGGNNGVFANGAGNGGGSTNVAGYVGRDALLFPGTATNGLSSKIELGDPQNLRITNGLTIEAWINPAVATNLSLEQILFRGDDRGCFDPYFLALAPGDSGQRNVVFHIDDGQNTRCGTEAVTLDSPITEGQWHHVAAVFEPGIVLTQAPFVTNELRIYVDGVLVATNQTGMFPMRDLTLSALPGVSIGARSRYDQTQAFTGTIDELSVYARALTSPEIEAVVNRGTLGKADLVSGPGKSLAKARVWIDSVQMDVSQGDNSQWSTRLVTFTATATNSILEIEGLLPGTLINGMTLTEYPGEATYQPEDRLGRLIGEDAYGEWTLEIIDTRAGATNGNPVLVQWQLDFKLVAGVRPPPVQLTHGIAYNGVLTAGGSQNFFVRVPQWAAYATNALLYASNRINGADAPLSVYFDNAGYPVPQGPALIGPAPNGVAVLSTNQMAAPFMVPGQTYFLTVTNPLTVAVNFGMATWFDLATLPPCRPMTNLAGPAGLPTYYQLEIPPGSAGPVVVWVSGVQTNLTLVASQTLPLPDLVRNDFISRANGTSDELVMVLSNSTPHAVRSGTWYVGVFNTAPTAAAYTIQACQGVAQAAITIVPLTNAVPVRAAAPPGPPQTVFYEFDVTNYVDAVLFELYDLSGDADLVVQRHVPSGMAPYYGGSYRVGNNPEQVVFRTGYDMPDLRGKWYVGIYNRQSGFVTGQVRAAVPENGRLIGALPFQLAITPAMPPKGIVLQWQAVIGEVYVVEFSSALRPPNWKAVAAPVVATTPCPAIEVPVLPSGSGFYRVRQLSSAEAFSAPLYISLAPGNMLRISWPITFQGYTLQYSLGLDGVWANANLPVTVEGSVCVVYDVIRATPRYYRLIP